MNDLISRQAAIIHFVRASKNYEYGVLDLKEITRELWEIPSAERKKGKWKRNITAERNAQLIFTKVYNCSECGYESVGNNLKNYCPECGAMMKGGL